MFANWLPREFDLVDVYCGQNFSLTAVSGLKKTQEGSLEESIHWAKNAATNNIRNVDFIKGKGEFLKPSSSMQANCRCRESPERLQ